jgi:hypothetical protein
MFANVLICTGDVGAVSEALDIPTVSIWNYEMTGGKGTDSALKINALNISVEEAVSITYRV